MVAERERERERVWAIVGEKGAITKAIVDGIEGTRMSVAVGSNGTESLVAQFIASVRGDLDSPVTSNFGSRVADYRAQAQRINDEIDVVAGHFERMRRISKEVETAMAALAKQLLAFGVAAKELAERWASCRSDGDSDTDAAVVLLKMELFLRSEAELINGEIRNWSNNIVHPLDLLVAAPVELRSKAVEKTCREYEAKFTKVEAEARRLAKQSGYTRSQPSHGELSEQLSRERLMVQHELCKFLLNMDSMEDKRGPQLLRHFMELFRWKDEYYADRLKTNEHFRRDLDNLEQRMSVRSANRCQQRNALFELKSRLEANTGLVRSSSHRRISGRVDTYSRGSRLLIASDIPASSSTAVTNVSMNSLTGVENDSFGDLPVSSGVVNSDVLMVGFLYKKSNKKLHKQWQKRRCRIQDGHFWLSHSDESQAPVKLSLLISDLKPSTEDPRSFDLYCRDRTYHLQAESEADAKRWVVAVKQEIARVKTQMLTAETPQEEQSSGGANFEFAQRKMCARVVRSLAGNHECADCSSNEDVQWLSNTGALVCIACSGVHRELGVHVSRMQALDLDVISPIEFLIPLATGNALINRLYEYNEAACLRWKPRPGCTMSDRQTFIQFKYRDRAYIQKVEDADALFCDAARELDVEKAYKALLSPYLTALPFETNGPFHQMLQIGSPMALPIAQLVVQLRIELPCIESMLSDCVTSGHLDLLTVLLHSRSISSAKDGPVCLQPLETLAVKTSQNSAAQLLRSVQSNDRSRLNQIRIPSSLLVATPDSGSLSRSSSSISPLPGHSPDTSADSTSRKSVVSSPPVNVLMRNGTTIAVSRVPQLSPGRSLRIQRSSSPSDVRIHPTSSSYGTLTTNHSLTNNSSPVFKGSTFGKCAAEDTPCFSIQCSYTQRQQQPERDPVVEVASDVKHTESTLLSESAVVTPVTESSVLLGSAPSASSSPHPVTEALSGVSEVTTIISSSPPQQIVQPTVPPVNNGMNNNNKAPGSGSTGSLRLSYAKGVLPSVQSLDEARGSASSGSANPLPALPIHPKPKLYNRSASEYNDVVTGVGALRDLHEQKMCSASSGRVPSNSLSESRDAQRSRPLVGALSTSFSLSSGSLSLDPIPVSGGAPRVSANLYVKGPGCEGGGKGTANTTERDGEATEWRARNVSGGNEIEFDGDRTPANKATTFSSFDSARASFMLPGERARFSTVGRGNGAVGPKEDGKKAMCADGAPAERAPGFMPKPAPPGIRTPLATSTPVAAPSANANKTKPPIPAPRRSVGAGEQPMRDCTRRCRALYDCIADNPDELSFRQGDVIVVSKDRIAGENDTWMEGYLASDPQRKGIFPTTFVTFQS